MQPHEMPGKSRLPVYCGLIPEKFGSGGWFCPSARRLQRPLCCCYTTPERIGQGDRTCPFDRLRAPSSVEGHLHDLASEGASPIWYPTLR